MFENSVICEITAEDILFLKADCPELFETLTPKEKEILDKKMSGMNYGQLGEEYGVTRERIRQILMKSIRRIQRSYLENVQRKIRKLHEQYMLETEKVDHCHDMSDIFYKDPAWLLEPTIRLGNCIRGEGIKTMGQLVQMSASDLVKIRNFGNKCLREIMDKLDGYGLRLGMTEADMIKWSEKKERRSHENT